MFCAAKGKWELTACKLWVREIKKQALGLFRMYASKPSLRGEMEYMGGRYWLKLLNACLLPYA